MIKNKKILIMRIFIMITLLMSTISCSQSGKQDTDYEASVITLNYTTSYGSALMQLLKARGSLEADLPDDVRVEWVNTDAPANTRDAMAAGRIDIASLPQATAISAVENGLPLVLLSNSVFQSSGIYSRNPEITSIDHIKSTHKISTMNLIGTSNFALMLLCKELYDAPQKLNDTMMIMSYADAFAAIESGREIDCAIFAFPRSDLANENAQLTMIVDLTPTIRKYELGNIIVVRQDFYNENPVLIEIFMQAAKEMIDLMNEHPQKAAQLLKETYDFYKLLSVSDLERQMRAVPPTLLISESAYDIVAGLMHEIGIIPHPPKKFSKLANYDSIPKR